MARRQRQDGATPAAVAQAGAADVPDTPGDARGLPGSLERGFVQEVRKAALARQFRVHYQPLVSVADQTVVGVEALLRWDASTGRIGPGRFVPVLEDTGLIRSVGEWVLAEACREVAGWPGFDGVVMLSANVSSTQLVPGFADMVFETLAQTGFPARQLCLELTNPAQLADPFAAWAELRRLKAQGVKLLIDDFGTAGASISDLKRFTIDAVKLDGSFVGGLSANEDDDAIVAALIGLAHALGMQVVAEGVETAEQLRRLRALECDLAQGYLFGPPGPGDLVGDRFRRHQLIGPEPTS